MQQENKAKHEPTKDVQRSAEDQNTGCRDWSPAGQG
jgi:hypothetical protein